MKSHSATISAAASLVVGCWVGLADEPSPGAVGGAEPNPVILRIAETNLAVSALDTNSVILSTLVETNSPALSMLETNQVIPRDARPNSRLDLQSFRIIWERNIFDPNRSGRYTRVAPRKKDSERRRLESFALVGTMSYEKGRFAFFEGSSSEYQKVLEASGNIAGYKVAEVAASHVKLESTNGQTIELPVGMQMKKEDEGAWTVTARAESPGSSSRFSSSSNSGPESSEALKRLLERRQQEGNTEPTNTAEAPLIAEEQTETTNKLEKAEPAPASGADEILKKLLQKREQELNK